METPQELLSRDLDKLRCFEGDPKIYIWCEDVIPLMEEYREQPKWIPVSERLPEEGQGVIVLNGGDKILPAKFTDGRFERYFDEMQRTSGMIDRIQVIYYSHVTHWQPFPQK